MNNRDYVTADKAFKTWQKLVCKLDDQLSQAGEMDRDLVANVRASLRSLTETKSAGALSEQLVCLHRAARPPVRHSLVWAVLQRLNEGPPQDPSREGRQIALSGLEADIRAVTKRSIELAHKLRLADTLYESCAELFEGVHLNTIEGVAALTGWKIDLIEDHGPRPFALTERRG
jgi:hypothetical protein